MKFRKSQGLSINILVIALIALVILIVVIFIFLGGVERFNKGLRDCKAKGGECVKEDVGCKEGEIPFLGICKEGEVCCIPT